MHHHTTVEICDNGSACGLAQDYVDEVMHACAQNIDSSIISSRALRKNMISSTFAY